MSKQEIKDNSFPKIIMTYYCDSDIPDHLNLQDRDPIIQIYLRRYAINHNNTVKFENGFLTFKDIYDTDLAKR